MEGLLILSFVIKTLLSQHFFSVDDDGNESIVNYQVAGDYIVVERVESRFTLRHGKEVACVFNESSVFPGLRS